MPDIMTQYERNKGRIHELSLHRAGLPIGYSEIHHRFETGQAELNGLLNSWWEIFDVLARTSSVKGQDDMRLVSEIPIAFYSQPHFIKAGVTFEEPGEGPLVFRIPAYGVDSDEEIRFCAHLDTVPSPEEGPIVPSVIEGQNGLAIVSEGETIAAHDNKLTAGIIMAVSQYLVQNKIPHPALTIMFTRDEETDSLEITRAPRRGDNTQTFTSDKAGPIGEITMQAGGYTGYRAQIPMLSGSDVLTVLAELGNDPHVIAPRAINIESMTTLSNLPFTLDEIVIGIKDSTDTIPTNSRNTVPARGAIRGTFTCSRDEMDRLGRELNLIFSEIGATMKVSPTDNPTNHRVQIDLIGKAGHPSKWRTSEDNGITSVLPDAAIIARILLGEKLVDREVPAVLAEEVRLNIGSMSWNKEHGTLQFEGEERFYDAQLAEEILQRWQEMVERRGGTWEQRVENHPYALNSGDPAVARMRRALKVNGVTPREGNREPNISDLNELEGNGVGVTGGNRNPHRADEEVDVKDVITLLGVFYDLAIGI